MRALAQEGSGHPRRVARERIEKPPALEHRAPQVGKPLVLIRAVARVVPADEVEQLVARGQLDLAQALVGLDPRRQLDLVAIGVEPAAIPRVGADDRAAAPERLDVIRKIREGALDEQRPGCDIHEDVPLPPGLAQPMHARGSQLLGEREDATSIRH